MKTPDPKTLLLRLEKNEPIDLPADDVARARALLAHETPDAVEIEALPPPLAEALLEKAVQRRATALIERLATSPKKELAKAAKKAAYRLRSIGVAVAEPSKPAAAAPAPSMPPPAEELPSLLSGVTGTGDRALVVVRPIRGGGLELFQVVFQDELGILNLERHGLSRGAYRQQLKELRTGRGPATLEVGQQRAREELSYALAANLRSRTPLPQGADELLRHLGVTPQEPPPLPQPEEADGTLAVQANTLHMEPELAGWLPPESELKGIGEKMEQLATSPLQLTEAQKTQQLFEAFHQLAERFFTPDRKQLYVRRLWAMAEVFDQTNRARAASVARAEARRLFHDAPGYLTRFGEELFAKVLALTRAMPAEAPKPDQPAAPPPNEKRSPGGLILP